MEREKFVIMLSLDQCQLLSFDSQEDEIFVPEQELSPEISEKRGGERGDDDKRKKELAEIRAEGLKEAKEIEEMSDGIWCASGKESSSQK